MSALYFQIACARGPGGGEAARQPGVPRHPVPVRPPDPRPADGFRAFGGAQSYPSRTKDKDEVDFSTGSVGLGVAMTTFASIAQDYLAPPRAGRETAAGRMIALLGDAELDEGNIYEALIEGGSTTCATAGGSSTTTARAWTRRPRPHVPPHRDLFRGSAGTSSP